MENQGKVLMDKYEFGRLLGQGNFAKVYYGRKIGTGQSVAIKVIDKEKVLKVGLVDQTKREISVMKLVEHPYVLQLFEVMANKSKIFYVMEYAKGGELFNKVAKGKLREESARKYFQQLMFAVDFCHSRGVYHRDLKPENLLLDENGDLKVSDFGLSALADSKRQDGLLHTTCGTPAYVSPEVICRKGYDGAKSDVWSCGVILFVLLAGYLPFHDMNLMEMYKKIAKAEYKCPNWIPREVRKLLSRMLDPNPSTRISSGKVLENPWFQRGLESKSLKSNVDFAGAASPIDNDSVLGLCGNSYVVTASDQDLTKTNRMNAFDLISLSTGFDLSSLFEDKDEKKDIKFTSVQPVSAIISKLEDLAKQLRMKILKKDGGLLRMERAMEGWKGPLSIDAEIFEFTPAFHLVEVKKSSGDTLEYLNLLKQDIRPALKDIVWAWHGEQQNELQRLLQI